MVLKKQIKKNFFLNRYLKKNCFEKNFLLEKILFLKTNFGGGNKFFQKKNFCAKFFFFEKIGKKFSPLAPKSLSA